MITLGILIVVLALVAVLGWYWHRSNAVYNYRTALIDEIHRLDREDIDKVYEAQLAGNRTATHQPSWRYAEFDSVPYGEMFLRPWRPLSSFYRDGFPIEPLSH